jgi:hypothetical protein
MKTKPFQLRGQSKFPWSLIFAKAQMFRSEDRDPVPPPRGVRRPSLPAQSVRKTSSSSSHGKDVNKNGWSTHYEKKKSVESLDRLTSRTLSPAPETLPRKFSRYYVRQITVIFVNIFSSGQCLLFQPLPPLDFPATLNYHP